MMLRPAACRFVRHLLPACLLLVSLSAARAADWTTYRGDNSRRGESQETLPAELALQWEIASPAAPEPAWSSAEGRKMENHLIGDRIKFDAAFEPVIADGKVLYGSSVDHQLHCVDLQTGETLWTFFTGGPIRLAPTLAEGRAYFGSDDGCAYCVDLNTGEEIWWHRAGPREDWLLARGEMISRWPIRTGLLVDGGVAYFGAGIFPHEDVYLYAVNADDGSVIWKQDNVSAADAGRNDLSPQGYLLATDDLLIVPSGRSMPAIFDRKTGEFLQKKTYNWRQEAGGVVGSTKALLADGQLYAGGPHHFLAVDQRSGKTGFGWFQGRQLAIAGDDVFMATGEKVIRANRMEYAAGSRERHKLDEEIYDIRVQLHNHPDQNVEEFNKLIVEKAARQKEIAEAGYLWQQPTTDDAALLATANLLILGGEGRVTAYATDSGDAVWTGEVDGQADGLAVADGHLLVSTTAGKIYCFAAAEAQREVVRHEPAAHDYPENGDTQRYKTAAEAILQQTDVRRGFCLVTDGNEGQLAYELARQSDLKIYMIESDAGKAAQARQVLAKAGLYGRRIAVHHFGDEVPYSNYFANLIVSDEQVRTGKASAPPAAVARHLKPVGGVLWTGLLALGGKAEGNVSAPAAAKSLGLAPQEVSVEAADGASPLADEAVITRHALPGAGDWSHQYGNPANTAVSRDTRIKGGLGVLWYGDPGPGEMVNRHDGAVGPLAVGGRLIVQGQSTIKAYDAYNGLHLWTYENEKALRTGVFENQNPGNLAASEDRVFHFLGDECFELDAATGQTLAVHRLPEASDQGNHEWGYIAVQDGVLFGTATIREELEARKRRRGRTTADATDSIFAIDLKTGKHRWTYHGKTISHHTIAIGPKQVYFIDSSITGAQRQEILKQDKSELAGLAGKERERAEERLKQADVRMATALDIESGEKVWASPVDVTDCSDIGIGGGKLTLMYSDGVLILCGANANGHFWKQFVAGEFERRRLVALSAEDGYKLWAKDANYRNRPNIIDNKVLAEPWMYDLHTGDQRMRAHPLTGKQEPWSIMRTGHHCGMLTGCDSGMLMFRSGYTGFYDLEQDAGTRHFAGHRLGCWINAIPANGLVMIPEASAGCVCQFSIASTIVLEPREAHHPWAIYSAVGSKTPVQQMAINLGAPGDRKAEDGTVWLSYPRYEAYQETSLDVKLDLAQQFAPGGGYRDVNEDTQSVTDTQTPWLYTSWAEGLTKLTLPLLGEGDEPATYTVRLHFAEREQPARFAVKLNGQTVLEDVSLAAANGDSRAFTREFTDLSVTDALTIELVAQEGVPALSAVDVQRHE